jgi:DNA-binding transcriptional LysR family regulator
MLQSLSSASLTHPIDQRVQTSILNMRRLSTTNLELAVWIGRLGSFTAAAERMHTTQPAVSARVKELEDALGLKLFARQGRGVELTPEGREFVIKAESLLRQLDDLSLSRSSLAGTVRIGISSICLDLLAAVTMRTAHTMPLVSYHVEIERAARLLYRLASRKIDLAIVSGPVEAHKFRVQSLGFDRMVWVASADLIQKRQQLPEAERLKGLPIWCVHPDSFYFSSAVHGLRDQGADIARINAIDNTLGVVRVVAAGAGIGLVSERLTQSELEAGVLVPVPDLDPCETIEFSIASLADSSSGMLEEVAAAAAACTHFRREPFDS